MEWVEALTIVLAVGVFKGWRVALQAAAAALAVLAGLVAVFGFAVGAVISGPVVRTAVGAFLLLFGLGWLYKAILRSAGRKALHDEDAAYEETREELMTHGHAFATAFGGVFLEGLEVVFVVVALGNLHGVAPAVAGALAALVVVAAGGVVLRRPLSRVPENLVKYAVGLMLTSFGTFFAGEGLGIDWWRSDLVLLSLVAGYAVASVVLVRLLRRPPRPAGLGGVAPVRWAVAGAREVWGLFVTDGVLAAMAVLVLLATVVWLDRFHGDRTLAGPLLAAGVVGALAIGLSRSNRTR